MLSKQENEQEFCFHTFILELAYTFYTAYMEIIALILYPIFSEV